MRLHLLKSFRQSHPELFKNSVKAEFLNSILRVYYISGNVKAFYWNGTGLFEIHSDTRCVVIDQTTYRVTKGGLQEV